MSARATLAPGARHLGGTVSSYVDRALPAEVLLTFDRHLGVCAACRAAADAERRLLSSLRTAAIPSVPQSLESTLRGMAEMVPPAHGRGHLAVLGRSAPPMHRSPVRAAMLAGLAAGASAAAAWSLGVAGVGAAAATAPVTAPPSPTSAPRSGTTGQSALPPAGLGMAPPAMMAPQVGPWATIGGTATNGAQSAHE